jgi:hypothetical protein
MRDSIVLSQWVLIFPRTSLLLGFMSGMCRNDAVSVILAYFIVALSYICNNRHCIVI